MRDGVDDLAGGPLEQGDVVFFSSRVIPGNERSILRLQNSLARLGVNIVTDETHPDIHVSGHPARDELMQMYQWVRPHIAIPVHGEMRGLMNTGIEIRQDLISDQAGEKAWADRLARIFAEIEATFRAQKILPG